MSGQAGFFDADERLRVLSATGREDSRGDNTWAEGGGM